MPIPNRYRPFAAIAAVIGWLALGLQLLLTIRLTIANGTGAWAGVWIYLGYFTVLTNLAAALALTAAASRPRSRLGKFFARPDVHAAIAMSIIVVAAIYHLLLRQLWQPQGWQVVGDDALHTVMPLLFVLHWWLAVSKANMRWRDVLGWQIYPAAYFVYALVRGALNGWYPYPFLDVHALGYLRVLGDALGVLLVFIAIGLLLTAMGRWQARRTGPASVPPTVS
ncbi:MAG TPA: Pr6Pr family membrane protein [Rhodanobacter sp.]|nr:Pr6Pr family membrane protein [Rhodanobacter sp.]